MSKKIKRKGIKGNAKTKVMGPSRIESLVVHASDSNGVPPPPFELAVVTYTKQVEQLVGGRCRPEEILARMRNAVLVSLEIGIKAQRQADALLVELIGHESLDFAEKRVCEKMGKILRGELDPRPVQPSSMVLGNG